MSRARQNPGYEPSEAEETRFEWLVQAAQDALPDDIPVGVIRVRLLPYVSNVDEDIAVDVVALDFVEGRVVRTPTTGPVGVASREWVYADLPNNAPKAWWYALDNAGWMRDREVRGRFILPLESRAGLRDFPVDGLIENPSPVMPPYEEIVDAFVECDVDGTEKYVVAFLEYIQQALHALPVEVQGDLTCEYDFQCDDADVSLVWCDDDILEKGIQTEGVPIRGETHDGRERTTFQIGKIYFSVRVPQRVGGLESRVDEPAYVAHRDVMKHGVWVANEMMGSGKWTYPTTQRGTLVTKKMPGHIIPGGPRAGEKTKPRFRGTWQFLPASMGGADHPGWKSEKDAKHWLPRDQGGEYHRRRLRRR